jgi:AcrR family transcriptional regulator
MKGTTRRLRGSALHGHIDGLTDQTVGRVQRRPEEKRARLLAAARTAFAKAGYGASVHEICQAAGVGIGTFYHQFPDKSDVMRLLMDEEHQFRVRAFDALAAGGVEDLGAEVARVLAGSDPALLPAMLEAIEVNDSLRDFARGLREESQQRLAAAITRARRGRNIRRPALDPNAAAWAVLHVGDVAIDPARADDVRRVIEVLVFSPVDDVGRPRA